MYGALIRIKNIMKVKKVSRILLLTGVLTICFAIISYADTRITRVHITITDIDNSSFEPVVTAASSTSHCEVADIWEESEFGEDYFEDEFSEISKYPVYIIELHADSGYYFGWLDVTIGGNNAQCQTIHYEEGGTIAYLKCEFKELDNWFGEIGQVAWKQEGILEWEPVDRAAVYELRLYKEEDTVGILYITQGTSYDFRPLMTDTGEYFCRLRPCMADGTVGITKESETCSIDRASANQFQSWFKIPEDLKEAESKGIYPGWVQDQRGWWYRKNDGMYEQGNWQKIGDFWYFFDQAGYMVSDQWVTWKGTDYYFDNSGILRE